MKGLSPPMDSSLTLTLKSTLGRFAGTAAITTLADLDPNLLPARSDLEASRVWAGILTEAAFPRAGATLAPKARVTLAQVFDIILIIQRSEVVQLCLVGALLPPRILIFIGYPFPVAQMPQYTEC